MGGFAEYHGRDGRNRRRKDKYDSAESSEDNRNDGKSFDEIINHFKKIETDKGNSDSKWHTENKKNLSNKFNSWKKKQNV